LQGQKRFWGTEEEARGNFKKGNVTENQDMIFKKRIGKIGRGLFQVKNCRFGPPRKKRSGCRKEKGECNVKLTQNRG